MTDFFKKKNQYLQYLQAHYALVYNRLPTLLIMYIVQVLK